MTHPIITALGAEVGHRRGVPTVQADVKFDAPSLGRADVPTGP
jgi:enolase